LSKSTFSQPDYAAEELRAVLPPKLVAQLDWATLWVEPGSHVDQELEQLHSDLLFSIESLRGESCLIYVLFEHQSAADPLMAYRMLRYQTRIWDTWMARNPDHGGKLPPILPVVFYNGEARWSQPTELFHLLRGEPALLELMRPFMPNFRFLLDDLARTSSAELREREVSEGTKVTLLALKVQGGGRDSRRPVDRRGRAQERPVHSAQAGAPEVRQPSQLIRSARSRRSARSSRALVRAPDRREAPG
jgi:predicted transposase/invertase (TIGR01784 family)